MFWVSTNENQNIFDISVHIYFFIITFYFYWRSDRNQLAVSWRGSKFLWHGHLFYQMANFRFSHIQYSYFCVNTEDQTNSLANLFPHSYNNSLSLYYIIFYRQRKNDNILPSYTIEIYLLPRKIHNIRKLLDYYNYHN